MSPFRIGLALLVFSTWLADASACSVPVFRYALERWQSDLFEVDLFHRGRLTDEQRTLLSRWEDQSLVNGGDRNWEIIDCDLDQELAADLQAVWEDLGNVALPHVVIRCPGGRQGSPIVWSGALSEGQPTLAASRPEHELVRQLLSGDSVVWVVLRGTEAAPANEAVQLLKSQLPTLMTEIELPAGVGLPGSELLARMPLDIRFSILDVAEQDSSQSLLRRTAAARSAKPVTAETTLILPVFGRGRAVQVLTADEIDADIISESSRFLCGACSCQVKQANPGFDLLLPVAWEERLYGEEIPVEAVAAVATTPSEPTYLAIPSGDAAGAMSGPAMTAREETAADRAANQAAAMAEAKATTLETSPATSQADWYLLGASVLMVGVLYAWRRQAAWSRRNAQNG